MRHKIAVVTGIASDLGSYLVDILVAKGYEIHALSRGGAEEDSRLEHLQGQIQWHPVCLSSYPSVARAVQEIRPHEFYHLGVDVGSGDEGTAVQECIGATHTVLQVLRDQCPDCRFAQGVSHEVFGDAEIGALNERTKFEPRSPEAIAQMASFELVRHFRQHHGLYAANVILFPHASPRSEAGCLVRAITAHVARIKLGLESGLALDNLCSRVDWGHTEDWAQGVWLTLQDKRGDDFVLATGQTHTVRELVQQAFSCAGLDYWRYVALDGRGEGEEDMGLVLGDAGKARRQLGWSCRRGFKETVVEMVREDVRRLAVASFAAPSAQARFAADLAA